ncbi:HAD-IB family hydrolase [Sphingobium sp. SCG-1]|nr:HAD-IB family hydrolase [Sphingobium sp. SCG-1]
MHLAIYDLDRTITKRGTFTPFLIFAARRRAPWRLAGLPLWIVAMACHKLGLVARKPLKQFGLRLLLGRTISTQAADTLAADYARHTLAYNVQPGALASIEADRAEGRMLIMATAAPDLYAAAVGTALGFAATIATRHVRLPHGGISSQIEGENCYGTYKLAMIEAWLLATGTTPATTRFYSDHLSDAPVLGWADQGFLVNAGLPLHKMAESHGWTMVSFEGAPK